MIHVKLKKNVYFIILKLITCWEINQVTSICQMDFLDNTCKKDLKQKKGHRILHSQISLGSKFQLQHTILIFWNKCVIERSIVKTIKTVNITIEFSIFELDYVLNFSWNWQFSFFRPNLPKKGASSLKRTQRTLPLNSAYSNYSRQYFFPWTNKFEFLGQICPEKVFRTKA